ncbi:hypothetical protein ACFVHM_31855, partial [Priestia megaterium]|uniref:hypothetical protein n=1 Tax=Priestia megaterium TaxID=1404 RepID=UPI0036306910
VYTWRCFTKRGGRGRAWRGMGVRRSAPQQGCSTGVGFRLSGAAVERGRAVSRCGRPCSLKGVASP